MRSLFTPFFLAVPLFAFTYGLKPAMVAPGAWCFFGKLEPITRENGGNMVNTCWVDQGDSWTVIDSGPTYAYAKEAHAAMKKIADKPVKQVLNTHNHDDHHLGNGYYAALGAEIIGQEDIKKHYQVYEAIRMEQALTPEQYAETALRLPDRYLQNHGKIGKLEILKLSGQGHTDADLVAWWPEEKVLFAGDLVFTGRLLRLPPEGNFRGWLEALEKIEELHPQVIVSGHGYRTDPKAYIPTRSYLDTLGRQVSQAMDNGTDLIGITKAVPMKEFGHLEMFDMLHGGNVYEAYQTLEWEE